MLLKHEAQYKHGDSRDYTLNLNALHCHPQFCINVKMEMK